MMYTQKIVTTYKGQRAFKTKDGKDAIAHKFLDDENHIYELMVREPVPDIPVDTTVGCILVFGDKFNIETRKYDKKIYIKSVVPIGDKK